MYSEQDPSGHETSDPIVPDEEVAALIDTETDRLLSGIAEEIEEYPIQEMDPATGERHEVRYQNGAIHADFLSPEGERVTIARNTSRGGVSTFVKIRQLAEHGSHGPYAVYKFKELEETENGNNGFKNIKYYFGGELYKDGKRVVPGETGNDPDMQSALAELQGLKKGGGNTGVHQSEFDEAKHSLEALKPEYREVLIGTEIDFNDLGEMG